MSGIQPISGVSINYSAMSTGRAQDNSPAYIQSRINDLYNQALTRQGGVRFSGTRTLRQFIDKNSKDGKKLHKIV